MVKKRLDWVDAAKGLLMILVVIGHFPEEVENPYITFIYWFHMPAFFILSGLFFKPVPSEERIFPTVKKRFFQLIVPYIFFIVVITLLRYINIFINGDFSMEFMVDDLLSIFIGGRFARGAYGVIWFITTLFTAYILFLIITRYLKPTLQIIALVFCYTIAQIEGHYVAASELSSVEASQSILIPWNMDVALLAVVYFAIGYYFKKYFKEISFSLWLVATLLISYELYQAWTEQFSYHLSLKFIRYGEPILDLVIPISFLISFLGIIQFITKHIRLRALEFIEKHSIIIMYFHILVDKLANNFLDYGILGYTLLGLFIPIILSILFQKFFPYAEFFLGNPKATKPFQKPKLSKT